MSLWNPMEVLANVELNEPIEAQLAAFAPASDARVQDVNTGLPPMYVPIAMLVLAR